MRLFFAIPLDETVRRQLGKIRDALQAESSGAKISWTPADKFHITLKFLGQATDQQTASLCDLMKTIPLGNPFSLHVDRTGFLPPRGHPRVIIATVAGDLAAAADLAACVERVCHEVGFSLERRKFTPHITLGRIRQSMLRFSPTTPSSRFSFQVNEIQLMRSQPGPKASVYQRVAAFQF